MPLGQTKSEQISPFGNVGLLPRSVVHFHAERLSLKALPVALPDTRIRVSAITVKGRTLGPLAERFIGCARELARTLS